MKRILYSLCMGFFAVYAASAQFYIGPIVGFKYAGLKGTFKQTSGGQVTTGNVSDASKTGFTFGITAGYQILPSSTYYKLDIDLDASYSSIGLLEAGYNSSQGAGSWGANGFDGGSSKIISFDIMPIHRLTFPSFQLLSPFAGVGFEMNLMNTGDITLSPPSATGTITGKGGMKVGLLIFYGVVIRATDVVQPYIQFKHTVPFGSDTEFTESVQQQGFGTSNLVWAIQDVPSYFGMTAGVRFTF